MPWKKNRSVQSGAVGGESSSQRRTMHRQRCLPARIRVCLQRHPATALCQFDHFWNSPNVVSRGQLQGFNLLSVLASGCFVSFKSDNVRLNLNIGGGADVARMFALDIAVFSRFPCARLFSPHHRARLAIRIISSCVRIDAPLAGPSVSSKWALLTVAATSTEGTDTDAVEKKRR